MTNTAYDKHRCLYLETRRFSLYVGPRCHRKDNTYGWGIVWRRFDG